MYWQEGKDNESYIVPDNIVDVVFNIACRALPVDHAYALSQAITRVLPWFSDEEGAGLHTVHGAESGNGWMRPANPSDLVYLSRRTKLILRLPRHRLGDAGKLTGASLDIAGNVMKIEQSTVRPLSTLTTIFSRYVESAEGMDESGFLKLAVAQLDRIDISPKKMLCGMENTIATPGRNIHTRSLMLADLSVEESVRLQQHGLGAERTLGCGLFIPHKDIKELRQVLD
jgi:CRISPR-associated protein Cas6